MTSMPIPSIEGLAIKGWRQALGAPTHVLQSLQEPPINPAANGYPREKAFLSSAWMIL
jgi:hypothetical protein